MNVYLKISGLVAAEGYDLADVKTRISAALIAYVRTLGVGNSVYYVRLIEQVNQVEGVLDYALSTSGDGAAWGTGNIPISTRETAVTDGDKVVFS